jgi:cation/acetate symporter
MDPLRYGERQGGAGIEGRVAFVAAALFLAGALVAVIDRVGAPARLVTTLGPAIAMAGFFVLGLLVKTMRQSEFYAAGRVMPAKYVGLAMSGLALALVPPMLPPGAPGGLHAPMLAGLAMGLVLAGFLTGPLLRKSAAYSLPDLFGLRFESPAVRSISALLVAIACGFAALAGFDGAVRGLEESLGMTRFSGALLAGFLVLMIVAPGGLAGGAWAAAVAAFVASLALLLPLVVLFATGSQLPLPLAQTDLWTHAMSRMALWATPVHHPAWMSATVCAAVAVGIAAFAPLLSPMIACRGGRSSSRAGAVGIIWFALLAAALLTGMAISVLGLEALASGRRPEDLPDFLYAASGKGLITICGQHAPTPRAAALLCAGAENFSGRISVDHLWSTGRYLITGVPELSRLSLAITALVSAGYIALALALTTAGVHGCATALGRDLLLAAWRGPGLVSRRIAGARLMTFALVAAAVYFVSAAPYSPQSLLALAILLSASVVAPLLLLSAWSRAVAADAALALAVGLCAVGGAAALAWRDGVFQMETMAAGALIGFFLATLLGFASSLRRKESETRPGRIFVEGLLYGDGEALRAYHRG